MSIFVGFVDVVAGVDGDGVANGVATVVGLCADRRYLQPYYYNFLLLLNIIIFLLTIRLRTNANRVASNTFNTNICFSLSFFYLQYLYIVCNGLFPIFIDSKYFELLLFLIFLFIFSLHFLTCHGDLNTELIIF